MDYINYFGGITIFSAFAIYISKLIINKSVDLGIEKYKSKLELDLENHRGQISLSLETHKAELSRVSQTHQIRMEHLQGLRVEILKQLHSNLCSSEDSLQYLTTMFQGAEWVDDTERDKKAYENLVSLSKTIRESRLYLAPQLCDKMETIRDFSMNIIYQIRDAKRDEKRNQDLLKLRVLSNITDEQLHKPINDWKEAREKMEVDFRERRAEIEAEFYGLMGGK